MLTNAWVATTAGAGAGIAKRFAAEGYKVALTSRRIEPLQLIEAEIKAAGGVAVSITSDAGEGYNSTSLFLPAVAWLIELWDINHMHLESGQPST